MILLNLSNVKKVFGADVLFDNISFNIEENDKIGLVGVNGAGKTTLFKILTGELSHDGGEIFRNKLTKIGYMQQHACHDSDRSVWDELMSIFSNIMQLEADLEQIAHNIESKNGDTNEMVQKQHSMSEEYEHLGGFTYKSRAKAALIGLGFSESDLSQAVSNLSGGQKTRVLLCKILLSNTNLLLLDEPTNHLDIASVEWLEEFLKTYNGAVVVISHDRYFLDRVTNKTFEMENNKLTTYNGNYSTYIKLKAENNKMLERKFENTRREITRVEGIIEQQKRWGREKNIKTAESKQKVIDRLEKTIEKPQNTPDNIKFEFKTKAGGGNDVLICDNLEMAFGEKKLFKNANMHIKKGERVFLLGANGCGKTTLLKIIMGILDSISGSFKLGANINCGYYDQTQSDLDDSKTAFSEVWDTYPTMNQTAVRNALAAFLFRGDDVFKEISILSGGERARILLLKLMLSNANFLLLDEPTNHLDITSREALEDALIGYNGTLFIVSHDRYFINKMADKICYMSQNELKTYNGNYDYFLEKHTEVKIISEVAIEKKNDYKEKKANYAAIRKLANQICRVETEIAEVEDKICALEEKLNLTEYATDYARALEVTTEIDGLKVALDGLYEKWDELQD